MTGTFDPKQLRSLRTVTYPSGLFAGVYDPTSQRYLAGTIAGQIVAWSEPDWGEPTLFRWSHRSWIYALAALPTHGQVLSVGYDRRLVWWDPKDGVPLREVRTAGRPLQLAVSADGRWVAVVDDDRNLVLYDATTGDAVRRYGGHPERTNKHHLSSVYAVAFSPDGRWVATSDRTGTTLVRDVDTGQVKHTLQTPNFFADYQKKNDGTANDGEYEIGGVRLVIFSPDSRSIIVGGMADYDWDSAALDGKMGLTAFDLETGTEKFSLKLPNDKGILQTAQFHRCGYLIAAGGGGTAGDTGKGALCVVDLEHPQDPVPHTCEMTIRSLSLNPAHDRIIVSGMMKTAVAGQVEIWGLPAPNGNT